MIFTLNIFVDHDLKFGGEEVVEETEEKKHEYHQNDKPRKSILNPDSL